MSGSKKLTGILGLLALVIGLQGCAAFRPLKGIPARYLPNQYKAISREHQRTIDPSLLGQQQKNQHVVDRGDVLGIFVEGVLGIPNQAPPVNFPIQPDAAPTIGFPLKVRDDGTISLPLLGAVDVRRMTVRQVEEHLRKVFIERKILKAGQDKIIVTLQKPRQIRVVVMRQETPQLSSGQGTLGGINLGEIKRGTGRIVNLNAGENDVLHALALSGGLPGLDAENAIYVIRRRKAPVVTAPSRMNPYVSPEIPNSPVPLSPRSSTTLPKPVPVTDNSSRSHIVQVASWRYGGESTNHVQPAVQTLGWNQKQQPVGNYRSGFNPPVVQQPAQPVAAPQYNPNVQISSRYAPSNRSMPAARPVTQNLSWGPKQQSSGSYRAAFNQPLAPQQAFQPAMVPQFNANAQISSRYAPSRRSPSTARPVAKTLSWNPNQQSVGNYRTAYNQPLIPQAVQPVEVPQHRPQHRQNPSHYAPSKSSVPTAPPMIPQPATVKPQPYVPQPSQRVTPQPMVSPQQVMPLQPSAPAYQPAPYQPQMPIAPQAIPENSVVWNPTPDNLPSGFPIVGAGSKIIRIPVRLKPGETINFTPEDVVLHDGDVVFIESRDTEIYYTGGLLGGGQYTLPRDYDLDVLTALSIAQSPQQSQNQVGRNVGGLSAVNGDVTVGASDVIILRQLADGTQIPIKVDLYKALRHPEERVIIKPRDIIILQYKKGEAIGAFFERHLLEGALFGVAAAQLQSGS